MSDSVGVPVTVTASLKPTVIVMVSPACSTPVPGEAETCVTVGATFVGVVGCVDVVENGATPVVTVKFRKSAATVSDGPAFR